MSKMVIPRSSSVAAPALDGTTDGTTAISRLTKSINDAKK